MQRRRLDAKFGSFELFTGKSEVKDEVVSIRDALLSKDGLVPAEKQDLFREQLQRTFSNDLIKALAS